MQSHRTILEQHHVAALRAMIAREGVRATAKKLGVGREPLIRLAGAFATRPGTVLLAEQYLDALPVKP